MCLVLIYPSHLGYSAARSSTEENVSKKSITKRIALDITNLVPIIELAITTLILLVSQSPNVRPRIPGTRIATRSWRGGCRGACSLAGADEPYPRNEPIRPVAVLAAEEARL